MNLHIPTLLLALLLGFLVLTLELGASMKVMRVRRELFICASACWAMLAGFASLTLRPLLPSWLADVGGNWLIAVGIVFYAQALHRPPLQRGQRRRDHGVAARAAAPGSAIHAARTSRIRFATSSIGSTRFSRLARISWRLK
jgi:hypothetical protein